MQAFTKDNFWDERFAGEDYAYGQAPNDFLREKAGLFAPGDKVLCLAEGEGRNAVFLAGLGCEVTGVDFSQEGKRKALQLAANQGVSIQYDIADISEYDMGDVQWDAVISIFCHFGSDARPAFYAGIQRALKPGGVVLFEVYNQEQLGRGTGGPTAADYLVPKAELRDVFADFQIEHAENLERAVVEGELHSGMASVSQLVARKI